MLVRSFGGFLPQPPYFSGGQRRGFTFGLSARRSFGREDGKTNRRKKKAALYPRPERRGFTARTGKFLLGGRRDKSLEKEKALAARRRQFIFYFWNVRQLSPLEGRERIILEQGARLLFAKSVGDFVVGRLQAERPATRIVR